MHVFIFVYSSVCTLRSPQQKVLKSQGRVSAPPLRKRHPPFPTPCHPLLLCLRRPSAQTWLPTQALLLYPFPNWRSWVLGKPKKRRGRRGRCGRSRHHRQKWRQRSTFPWQWWHWRACWTPQNFLLWVLRDTGQGQDCRLNKVNPKNLQARQGYPLPPPFSQQVGRICVCVMTGVSKYPLWVKNRRAQCFQRVATVAQVFILGLSSVPCTIQTTWLILNPWALIDLDLPLSLDHPNFCYIYKKCHQTDPFSTKMVLFLDAVHG